LNLGQLDSRLLNKESVFVSNASDAVRESMKKKTKKRRIKMAEK
jgi:hypothetical protein